MDDKAKKSSTGGPHTTRTLTTSASQGPSSNSKTASRAVPAHPVAAANATKTSTSTIHMTTNENEYDDDFYLNNDDDEDLIDDYDDDDVDFANEDEDEDFNMEEDDDEDNDSQAAKKIVSTNRSVSNAINLPPVNKPATSNTSVPGGHVSSSLSTSLMASKNKEDSRTLAPTSSTSLTQQRAAGYLTAAGRKRNVELDDEFKYEVLTPDKIVNHMIDCIKEVNQVLELPPTTTRILLHHFRWDKEKLMERFYDGDQDRLFKEAHIVSPFKNVNSAPVSSSSSSSTASTTIGSSSKKVRRF